MKNLVIKNIKTRYAGSALGMLWVIINPLLLSVVVAFIFTEIIKVNIPHFYLFVISGMLPWSFFSNSLQEADTSIVANAALLRQFSLPREFIPLSSVIANFFIFLSGLVIVLAIVLAVNFKAALILPVLAAVLILHLIFTAGLALLLSSVYVYLRDLGQFLGVLLMFWLWLTPVFYSLQMVPGKYHLLFRFNPLTPYIDLYRSVLFDPALFCPRDLLVTFVLSLASFFLGYLTFLKKESGFLKAV
ncbi:MAG: ABC transporter permease [Candidatus Omnitrophica bacterium]|nr:ABC transporter permease [Candidatus Omnitrophota bacterium]